MKKIVLNISLSLLILFGISSCNIKEDMSNCPGSIILDYSAYSETILDEIESEEQINVFIFDTKGICVENYTFTYGELEKSGLEFEVPIKYRNYKAVVWHGLNSPNYSSNRMKLGESYKDFFLRLNYDLASKAYSKVPDPLWASMLEPIDFCAKITRHRVHMTRLHTKIDVNLQQKLPDGTIKDLDMEDYKVRLHAHNNVYHTDYTIDEEESEDLEYNNNVELSSGEDLDCACFGTLRLMPEEKCFMTIETKDGSQKVTINGKPEFDLVKYMLESKTDQSMSDQQFLDRNKVWKIDLLVELPEIKPDPDASYVAIMLKINGWVVWFTSSDLN